ncbi:MAG: Site-specific recombinase XerD [Sphingobacteriaceae bacterium]|nr:Site-specific recombinase XerD [Sphingobacteriaceae bacterium]
MRSKNGDWFVKYFYELPDQPGKFKEFRVRDGINYIHDISDKEKALKNLLEDVTKALKAGYNPFEQKQEATVKVQKKEAAIAERLAAPAHWTLSQAIDKFHAYCEWKGLSDKTIIGYKSFTNNLIEWLDLTGKNQIEASQFSEADLIRFLDVYFEQEDWEPRTYNNHLHFFKGFFARVAKLEKKETKAKYVIDLSDVEFKVDKAERNKYYSATVGNKVKKELEKNETLNYFVKWIFYSCMRPKEIRQMQIKNIDIEARQIKVPGPTGKTGDRLVPISDELLAIINELKLAEFPLNYYAFGKGGKPNPEMFPIDFFGLQYLKIKVKLGLDKNYTMYSWKHTRVVNLIYAGFKDNQIMTLTGHRNAASFEKYKRDLVLDPGNVMSGKTIEF